MPDRHHRFWISLTLILVTILSACQSQPTMQPTSGPALSAALKELTGTVSIKQAGAADFSPATLGLTLLPDGSIQTGADGRARLDLSTGTIIRVSPSSLFTLTSNQPSSGSLTTQLSLTLGRIFVILNGGNLSVNTPSGVASVRGSYLSVTVDPVTFDVYVTCLEGNCSAGNGAGSANFGTGQKTVLFHCDPTTGQCTVPSVGPMSPDDFQAWLNENPEAQQVLNSAYATMTALATQPPATQSPATQPPATEPPAPATPSVLAGPINNNCLNVTGPGTGSHLDPVGTTIFSWDPRDGASSYKLTIHYPDGTSASFETSDTNVTRYAESMPSAGSYSWDVTAYDSTGNQICKTGQSTFSKPKTEKAAPKPPSTQPPPPPTQGG